MLTGIAVAPDVTVVSVADDSVHVDELFVQLGGNSEYTIDVENFDDRLVVSNVESSGDDGIVPDDTAAHGTTDSNAETFHGNSESADGGLNVSNIGSSGWDGVSQELPGSQDTTDSSVQTNSAVNTIPLPLPPAIPNSLGRDLTSGESQTVARANELYNSITRLRAEKHNCEALIARLEAELAAAKTELDQAQTNQQAAQATLDQAVKDADAASDELRDLNDQLKQLNADLKKAKRARNGYAAAVGAAGRLSNRARRRGNQAEADGFARQVRPNAERYQEKVTEIRDLNSKIKTLKQKIKAAKQMAGQSNAVKAANRALRAAEKQTAAAQKNHNAASKRLEDAKRRCEEVCETLKKQESEYLGDNGEGGVVDAAHDAVATAEQRQQERLNQEAIDRQDHADAVKAAQLAQSNQIRQVDLKVPSGVNKDDISAKDITRLIWQQEGIKIPSNGNDGNQVALAAAIKSFEAKALNNAVQQLATVLFQGAYNQLRNIIPALGALDQLAQRVHGFQEFLEGFRNGELKVQKDTWSPKWGTVTTTTVYNCRTCQYITTTTVTFSNKRVRVRAGGAGRSGIFVPRHLRGKTFTVTHFGTVG